MAYKSLLTIATDIEICETPLQHAIAMARMGEAHLDVQCIGVDRTQTGYYYAGANAMVLQQTLQQAQQDAEELEAMIRARLSNEDINWSCESGVAQLTGLNRLIAHRARFSDLVVLPKPYGENLKQELEAVVESAMFEGHAPVMVVPEDMDGETTPKRIIIAWNESAEALAAIRAALPLLKNADLVNVAVIDPPTHGPDRSDPGGALSQMLARHGVKAEISVLAKTMPRVADVLVRHVRDLDADLLVMGAYGHSRFREAILGGATRNMLELAEVPVLLAH